MAEIVWHASIEALLSELCDESQVRCRLHQKHFNWYNTRNKCYTLPVVILSVLSGSGNFLAGQFDSIEKYLIIGIGCVSILTSIISSVSQFLKLAELSESHRVASLAWGRFYSKIKFTLLLQRHDRESCRDFFTSIVSDYERLFEISPVLRDTFTNKVKLSILKRKLKDFQLPFYLNGYKHVAPLHELEEAWEENSIEEEVRIV